MELTKDQICEIADLLDLGLICFFHTIKKSIESHPNPEDPNFDPEPWQDILNKIDSDGDNYLRFDKMNSNQDYKVMEEFTRQIADFQFRELLLAQLKDSKPFANFKNQIDQSDWRGKWFEFKTKAQIEWVEQQLKEF